LKYIELLADNPSYNKTLRENALFASKQYGPENAEKFTEQLHGLYYYLSFYKNHLFSLICKNKAYGNLVMKIKAIK